MKQTTRARFQEKRSGTLAALRNDRLTRSDDESKWDPRQLQYFRCYSNKGELVTGLPLEQALSVVIAEDGFVEANYKDPKDPRKKGVWSDTVTHRPLRVQVVLDAKFSHLATKEAVESVCAIRLLKSLVVDMMEIGMLGEWSDGKYVATTKSVQEGRFWASKSQKVVASERLKPLLAKSLGTLIRDLMKDLGVGAVNAEAEEGGEKETTRLSGHFLRGHAGSIAYTLAMSHGASWEATEGVDRARHTLPSFLKSYSRGVVPRLVIAFNEAKNKKELRLEEALRG